MTVIRVVITVSTSETYCAQAVERSVGIETGCTVEAWTGHGAFIDILFTVDTYDRQIIMEKNLK